MNKRIVEQYLRPLKPLPTDMTPQGEPMQKIKCILFDIYGTLFISGSGDISLTMQNSSKMAELQQLLNKFAINQTLQKLLNEFYRAIEDRHNDLRAKGVDYPEVYIDQIWMQVLRTGDNQIAKQFAIEFELIVNPVYPMPNLDTLLFECRRQGLLMGLISNAQFYTPYLFRWFLNSDVEELGFSRDLLFYSYRHEVAKPSHKLFYMAANELKDKSISPSAVLYIGNDMLNDIFPAKRIGFQAALFAGDKRSLRLRLDDPRCKDLSADMVITELRQLIPKLRYPIP